MLDFSRQFTYLKESKMKKKISTQNHANLTKEDEIIKK
jgi:hypothetical protein